PERRGGPMKRPALSAPPTSRPRMPSDPSPGTLPPPRRLVSRRLFLRGFGGATLGLPFLEALAPRVARGQEAPVIQRFGVFFACNGVDMGRWFPAGPYGALTEQHLLGTANEAL